MKSKVRHPSLSKTTGTSTSLDDHHQNGRHCLIPESPAFQAPAGFQVFALLEEQASIFQAVDTRTSSSSTKIQNSMTNCSAFQDSIRQVSIIRISMRIRSTVHLRFVHESQNHRLSSSLSKHDSSTVRSKHHLFVTSTSRAFGTVSRQVITTTTETCSFLHISFGGLGSFARSILLVLCKNSSKSQCWSASCNWALCPFHGIQDHVCKSFSLSLSLMMTSAVDAGVTTK